MSAPRSEQQTLLPQHRAAVTSDTTHFAIPRRPVPARPDPELPQAGEGTQVLKTTAKVDTQAEVDSNAGSNKSWHGSEAYWQPIWTKNAVLVLFTILFAALATALIVMWRVNASEDGFALTASRNPLSWKYGPTAILVVVLSLWRQVDYCCKTMQPWQHLWSSPSPASESIMMDYLSPLNIKSFARAIRLRHHPVVASIAGFALLKVVILVSTGLLDVRSTNLERDYQISLAKTFNGSAFWDTVTGNKIYLTGTDPTYGNVSSYPVSSNFGVLDKNTNGLATPLDLMAFQSFNIPPTLSAKTVWANVDVFVPNISCETAETVFRPRAGESEPYYQLRSDTCSTDFGHIGSSICQQDTQDCPPSQFVYGAARLNCSAALSDATHDYTQKDPVNYLTEDTPYDFRYALLVMNITYQPAATNSTRLTPVAHEISAVICKTDYSISNTKVSFDNDTAVYTIDKPAPGEHMKNLSAPMLGEIMWAALRSTTGIYTNVSLAEKRDTVSDPGWSNVRDPLFQTVLRSLGGNNSISSLLSANTLQEGASKAFSGIATQLMKSSFLMPINDTITARGRYMDERLHIGLISLWIMFAALIAMVFLTLAIMFTRSRECVLHDPTTLAAHAVILSSSSNLHQLLQTAGRLRTSQLGTLLQRHRFSSSKSDDSQQIHTSRAPYAVATMAPPKKQKKDTWVPTAATYPMIALTMTVPLIVIVVLEILFQTSKRHQGIADVTGNEDTARYLSRYLSALTMLLVATSFSALDFTIASFAPYSLLRAGGVPARRVMTLNILGKLPPVALVQSLRTRQFGSAFSNLAAIIGSVLTIIVAGLWDTVPVAQYRGVTASRLDSFNTSWYNSSTTGDNGAVVTLDQVQHGSAYLPTTIWNNTVMPLVSSVRFDIPGQQPVIARSASQNITLGLDSLLPELTCDILDDQYVSIEYTSSQDRVFGVMNLIAQAPVPTRCNPDGNLTYNHRETVKPPSQFSWFGGLLDLNISEDLAGCPSIGIIFGKTQEAATRKSDVTVLLCSQRLRQVTLNVTYGGNNTVNLSMKPNLAPVPLWETATFLTNGTPGIDSFPYRVQNYLATASGETPAYGTLSLFNTNGDKQFLDQFFNHIVYGPNGTSLEDLAGRGNRQILVRAVQTLYTKYMSLVIDMKFRQSQPQSTSQQGDDVVRGTVDIMASRLQLKQTSKLVLQICLAFMTLFGVAALLLTDLRSTLPRNPCSIASTMGFLAGSDLCQVEEKRWTDLDAAAYEGSMLSLGWWEQSARKAASSENEAGEEDNSTEEPEIAERRFGIDIGVPAQLGFRESTWSTKAKWTWLRRRKR